MSTKITKYVVINGDDFGYSDGVNQAIIKAHQHGILTNTSLMVTGDKAQEAVQLAKQNPQLGVGLHLVLCCGKSVLPHHKIPHLVDQHGYFHNSAAIAGLKYQFIPQAKIELKKEIKAQLQKFQETGLCLSHVDGHLHLHTHPLVLEILANLAQEFGIKFIRLPDEELNFTLKIDRQNLLLKTTYRIIFKLLKMNGQKLFSTTVINNLTKVYGLLQTGKINESYLLALIPQIKARHLEIYSHPQSVADEEFKALCSQQVKHELRSQGFQLMNYLQIAEKIAKC